MRRRWRRNCSAQALSGAGGFWLRQQTVDGQTIVHVDGRDLDTDDVHRFGGRITSAATVAFEQRVDAKTAVLRDGYWEFHDADVVDAGRRRGRHVERLICSPRRSPASSSRKVSCRPTPCRSSPWQTARRRRCRSAGLDATPYLLRREQLLALPLSLAAMTLVAGCFSLRLFRMGGVQRHGFGWRDARASCFMSSTKIIGDLGNAGFVSVPIRRVVARGRGLSVRRVCVAPSGGRLMGCAIVRRQAVPKPEARLPPSRWRSPSLAFAFVSVFRRRRAGRHRARAGRRSRSRQALPRRRQALLRQDAATSSPPTATSCSITRTACCRATTSSTTARPSACTANGHVKMTDERGDVTYARSAPN